MTESYKRNQISEALWRVFDQAGHSKVPATFLTRIKRLFEIDRAKHSVVADGSAIFAFFDSEPEGKGIEIEFSLFNVFCLAIGLDLLDAGYPQAQVVFVLQNIRGILQQEFNRVLENPPDPKGPLPAEHRLNDPKIDVKGTAYADCRIFMVIEKIELKEVLATPHKGPYFVHPHFFRGLAELNGFFFNRLWWQRKCLVMEIAYLVVALQRELAKVEPRLRGRR